MTCTPQQGRALRSVNLPASEPTEGYRVPRQNCPVIASTSLLGKDGGATGPGAWGVQTAQFCAPLWAAVHRLYLPPTLWTRWPDGCNPGTAREDRVTLPPPHPPTAPSSPAPHPPTGSPPPLTPLLRSGSPSPRHWARLLKPWHGT